MSKGQLKNYKIGNRSYSITQLLGFGGVREVVSSRKTEGSKRELLRDLLRKDVITPEMLRNPVDVGPPTYGAQTARAGRPLHTNAGEVVEGPHRFHDPFMRDPTIPIHLLPWTEVMADKRLGLFGTTKDMLFTGQEKKGIAQDVELCTFWE